MNKRKGIFTQQLLLTFFLCFLIPLPNQAKAAAWLLDKGETKIINNMLYYRSKNFIDNKGRKHPQATFHKIEYNPYVEYGFNEKYTIGINPRFAYAHQRGRLEEADLTEVELFVRHLDYQNNNFTLSSQYLIKFPGPYTNTKAEILGARSTDYEQRSQLGYGFKAYGRMHYANLELAYRYRDITSDEIRLDGTLGIRFADKWQWLEQVFSTYAFGALPSADPSIANTTDYRLVKIQSSALYEINKRLSFQLGITQDIYSRNTGKGAGLLTALWVQF